MLRRLQLVRGLQWLRSAEGDQLALLLRGHPSDIWPTSIDPISRSATGTVLVAESASAARLLAAGADLADWRPTGTRVMAIAAEDIAPANVEDVGALARTRPPPVSCSSEELTDLVPLAEKLSVEAYADLLGAEPDSLLGALPVLDNFVCPQTTTVTDRMVTAVDALRDHLCVGTAAFFVAVVAPRLTADLVTRTLAILLSEGRWPGDEVSMEQLFAGQPLTRMHLSTTNTEVSIAGDVIQAGTQFVVLTCATVKPRLLDMPLVYATASAVLAAIRHSHPRLEITDRRPINRRHAPVTGGLHQLPVSSSNNGPPLTRP